MSRLTEKLIDQRQAKTSKEVKVDRDVSTFEQAISEHPCCAMQLANQSYP